MGLCAMTSVRLVGLFWLACGAAAMVPPGGGVAGLLLYSIHCHLRVSGGVAGLGRCPAKTSVVSPLVHETCPPTPLSCVLQQSKARARYTPLRGAWMTTVLRGQLAATARAEAVGGGGGSAADTTKRARMGGSS